MKSITASDLRAMLRDRMGTASIRQFAKVIGVSHAYVYDVLAGRRDPGKSILVYLGYEKVSTTTIIYRRRRTVAAK